LIKISEFNSQDHSIRKIFSKNEAKGRINDIKRKNSRKRSSVKNIIRKALTPQNDYPF